MSLTDHAQMSQMTDGIVIFRTYLKTCEETIIFDLYTPIYQEKLYRQLANVEILKLSHVQRFFVQFVNRPI